MALPYDIYSNPTFIATQQAKDMVRDVATGRRTMVLICSDTGFRKSYETKHCLRQCRVPFHECAPSTESALVRVLWGIESGLILHKGRKPAVIVADDQDAIWQRPTIANQMKSVFGSDRRCVIFETPEALKNEDRRNSDSKSERARYKATIAPPTFGVLVRLICHANLNYTHPSVVAGLSEHFRALVSKGLDPHWIPNDAENDGRDVFLHTHWLATEGNSLRSEGFPYEVARRAVEFYVNKVHLLIDICPRRLSQIAYTILNNPDPSECAKRLSHMLRDTDQRPKLVLPTSWIPVLLWPSELPRRPDPARQPDPPPAASAPGPVEPEPDPDPRSAASAPIPVAAEPDPDPPPAAFAPIPVAQEPDPDPAPAASAPTSIAPAEPPSRTAILQDVARMLRGRIGQAVITGTAERLQINGYDENRRLLLGAEWPSQREIQAEFLLQLLNTGEANELRTVLAGNGAELPKGHIPIREIKMKQEKFKVPDIEWMFTCGPEAKTDLITRARHAKVTRPWRGSCVQLNVVDGQLSFERSPFEYDFGDLDWALKKNWANLSLAPVGLIKVIVPGLLGDYVIYLRGYETGPSTEIEIQRQIADIAELSDRANLRQIDDAFDNYWSDDLPPEPPVPSGPEPAPTIDIDKITVDRELSEAEMRHLTLQWGLKHFRGRAGPLDIVAYQRRCGFLKIAGTKLTQDQLVIVRKKPKAFWQEEDAAERWLAEMVSQSTPDHVPQGSEDKHEVKSEDGDGEPP